VNAGPHSGPPPARPVASSVIMRILQVQHARFISRVFGGRRGLFWAAAALVAVSDQLTKHLFMVPDEASARAMVLVPGFLNLLKLPLSRGNLRAAFSWGPDWPVFYIVLTLLGLCLIGWLFVTTPPTRLRPYLALGLVCGGALGNLIDRIRFGVVRDFIDAHWMDWKHWPTFNIADAGICIGVGLLLLEAILQKEGNEAAAPEDSRAKGRQKGDAEPSAAKCSRTR